ncbi:MAG: ABC transporter permease [Defluviitaleaceae bacterium]|nr:ABC transporter permease [Defluviitaleaceae bacterium]MCL2276149.1 ABC transporter permease [Defluviitaleaceae bacterium]
MHKSGLQLAWHEIKNDWLALICLFLFIGLIAVIYIWAFAIDETVAGRLSMFTMNQAPSSQFPLGTDPMGRCMMQQLVLGARNSLNIAFVVTAGGASIGMTIGLFLGYYAGHVDNIAMRLIALWGMVPFIMMVVILRTLLTIETWFGFSMLLILVGGWLQMSGLVRVMTLQQGRLDYVSASKTLGTPNIVIMFREVFPNLVSIITSGLTLALAGNIGAEIGLTFLGFGLPPGTASLGQQLSYARSPGTMQQRPWQWIPAAVLVLVLMLCINFVGQALNRAADARKRSR